MADRLHFVKTFNALTGFTPLSWQTRLYEEWFAQGRIPAICNLPTGLGKTSVIPIWLIALAQRAEACRGEGGTAGLALPRRLVCFVNPQTLADHVMIDAAYFQEPGGSGPDHKNGSRCDCADES